MRTTSLLIVTAGVVAIAGLVACGDAARAPAGAAGGGGAAPAAKPPVAPQARRDLTTEPAIEWTAKGSGELLRRDDLVMVHLVGTVVADGKVFVDTRTADAPIPHRVGSGHLVPGLDLVFPRLRVGDRVSTRLRSDLAYGDGGVPQVVPAKAEVSFDVEVLSRISPPTCEVLAKGEGREARFGTLATVHYVGTLPDGTKFDSSRDRGAPYQFRVGYGEVIEGWDQVVSRMRVGDRWKVVVPWVFAYGAEGSPPVIPPRTDLTFEIEVLRVDD